jgi:hypothetical protein
MNHQPKQSVCEVALSYAQRGWAVFPCKPQDKTPATRCGFNDATKNSTKIKRWWYSQPEKNLAIATGAISGVVVVDVDPRHDGNKSLTKLEAENGKLPETVLARTGGGGRHLYFRHPGGVLKCRADLLGPGVDIKADGGYVIAPPSVHPSGQSYRWKRTRSPDEIPLADLPEWLLRQLHATQKRKGTQKRSTISASLNNCASVPLALCVPSVEDAIKWTIPSGPGQRHRAIFKYVRALKSLPGFATADLRTLRPHVEQWFTAAEPYTSDEHDFMDTLADFATAWQKCEHSIGSGPMAEALREADRAGYPLCAQQYDSERVRRLVGLCRELQQRAGDKPFYLASRTAAMLLGGSAEQAARYMILLCVDGILKRVTKGHTGRASEYRYIGDETNP